MPCASWKSGSDSGSERCLSFENKLPSRALGRNHSTLAGARGCGRGLSGGEFEVLAGEKRETENLEKKAGEHLLRPNQPSVAA